MQNILVTGAAGFIGSYLCEFLLDKDLYVVGIDNLSNGNIQNLDKIISNKNFKFLTLNVCDTELLIELFEKYDFDEVWHLAANTDIISSHESPLRDFIDCTEATVSVLEAIRKTYPVKMIFASSGSVYGDLGKGQAVTEKSAPLKPLSTYGAGKLASEGFITAYSNLYSFKSYIFRFGNVLGDRINHGVIYDFARKLKLDSKNLLILGNGHQEKNYFRVHDCIKGMWEISQTSENIDSSLIINLGNSTLTNVKRIAEIVIEESKLNDVQIGIEGSELAWPGDQPIIRLDCSEASKFGWKCEVDSDGAVRLTARELLSQAGVI